MSMPDIDVSKRNFPQQADQYGTVAVVAVYRRSQAYTTVHGRTGL